MMEQSVSAQLQAKVDVLAVELPGLTFGYLGNVGTDRNGRYDDRSWYVFLPHPGRVGTTNDSVGGFPTHRLPAMLADWHRIEATVRRLMATR